MSQKQLRNDLLDRIKDRHFVWWHDSSRTLPNGRS